jgi:hypothetical protein
MTPLVAAILMLAVGAVVIAGIIHHATNKEDR